MNLKFKSRLTLEEGKYELTVDDKGVIECLSYGEPCQNFISEELVLSLVSEIILLKSHLEGIYKANQPDENYGIKALINSAAKSSKITYLDDNEEYDDDE